MTVPSLPSSEPSDGGGALLPDGRQEDNRLPDLLAAEQLHARLESHDLQCGRPARSAAVSFINSLHM